MGDFARRSTPHGGSKMLPSSCISRIFPRAAGGIFMTRIYCVVLAVALAFASAFPANALDVTGTWLIQDTTAKVRIYLCGEALCGNVAWLSQPLDAVTGKPQTDKLN